MKDYKKEYSEFSLPVPEEFSFPLDIFDKWGERPALFWTDGVIEKKYSFSALTSRSSKAAGFLRNTGIGKGDRVLVMLPNIPEWWEVMLALMRIHAVPIPATTQLTSEDILYRLKAIDIKAVIAAEEDAEKVEDAARGVHGPLLLIAIGERHKWHDYVKGRNGAELFFGERASSDEPAIIYFTSGTTGLPKLVLHTQASYPFAHLLTGKYWLDLGPDDIHWNLSDTGWAKAAWSSLFGPWHMGATIFSFYRKSKFDPSSTLDILHKYPITTFCAPPTAYRMMVKETAVEKFGFKTLRHFIAAGEPLNKEIIEIWKERTGRYIYDGYGQTETVNVLANLKCLPVKPGSMGVPVPGFTVDIIDDEGRALPPNAEGDISIKIKPEKPVGLFKEYIGNPEATKKTIKGDWYITGDRGYKDEDGYFYFKGRADDIILASGYRIGPFEVESVLIEHPAVKESAVVASPDELRGEVVKAFIVLTTDHAPSEALAKELQEFVKTHSAPYKYPRKIEFVKELPKTISGKIKRKELKVGEWHL